MRTTRLAEAPEVLHILRHQLERSILFEAGIERAAEGLKGQPALALQKRVGHLLFLLFEVGRIGLQPVGNLISKPVRAQVDRRTDLPRLHLKRLSELFAACAGGYRAVAGKGLTQLRVEPERSGCGIELFAPLDALNQLIGLAAGQPPRFFELEVRRNLVTDLFERTLMGRLNLLDGKDYIAAVGADRET